MSIMKRVFYCLIFTILLLLLANIRGFSDEKQLNYGNSDSFLEGYFTRIDNMEDKVKISLEMINIMYPDWQNEYEFEIFDCSEMSEYVKYFFGKCGIESTYCQSNTLYHCWIEVKGNEDKILIECTTLLIVPKEYHKYYYKYNDVKYNCEMRRSEIDWYNSPIFN